jgi:nicotinate-nucleotide adenylyltransferase
MAALAPIAIVPRPGARAADWPQLEAAIGADAAAKIRARFLKLATSPVSSTEVRRRLAEGKSIRCWVPDPVVDYIEANGLYR